MRQTQEIRYSGNGCWPLLWLILLLAACESREPPVSGPPTCDTAGYLETELVGAIRSAVNWRDDQLSCEGMPRPEGRGARLRFSGSLEDAAVEITVAIILGIPDLERLATASELPTNVTLIEEGAGRFFATQDTAGCWTDVAEQTSLVDEPGDVVRIGGTVYCVSPLAELNGGSSISFTELRFSGRLDWTVPE